MRVRTPLCRRTPSSGTRRAAPAASGRSGHRSTRRAATGADASSWKTKITAKAVTFRSWEDRQYLGRGLAKRLDALGAQHLLHQAAVLHDADLLQVRLEGPVGGALREGTVMPKHGRLAAICTLSHRTRSFQMIPRGPLHQAGRALYHRSIGGSRREAGHDKIRSLS